MTPRWLRIVPLLLTLPAASRGSTFYAASNGLDAPGCGEATSPCRTINRAIAGAQDGDEVVIGPGRYGSLDRSAVLGDTPGEEVPGAGCTACTVLVDRAVRLVSRDGADATVIHVGRLPLDGVVVTAAGATVGKPRHGFTITGAGLAPRESFDQPGSAVRVAAGAGGVAVAGNVAVANLDGFRLSGDAAVVTQNVALANDGLGFIVEGAGSHLAANHALANGGSGFHLAGDDHLVRGDAGIANDGEGFDVASGTGVSIRRASAIGNLFHGVAFVDGFPGPHEVRSCNLYGNGTIEGTTIGANCGLAQFADLVHVLVDARNDFWGVPTGPAFAEPADGACAFPGGETVVTPFAAHEFRVR